MGNMFFKRLKNKIFPASPADVLSAMEKIEKNAIFQFIDNFIEEESDINIVLADGETLLTSLCANKNKYDENGVIMSIERLIRAGININVKNKAGNLPVDVLCSNLSTLSSPYIMLAMKLLIDAGADINNLGTHDSYTVFPIHRILYCYSNISNEYILPAIKLLIDSGADTASITTEKYTLLHVACCFMKKVPQEIVLEIIKILVGLKINMNAVTTDGYTALHFILLGKTSLTDQNIIEAMNLLISAGADVNITISQDNNRNMAALHMILLNKAKLSGRHTVEAVNILISAHARLNETMYMNNLIKQLNPLDILLKGITKLENKYIIEIMKILISTKVAGAYGRNLFGCVYMNEMKLENEQIKEMIDLLLRLDIPIDYPKSYCTPDVIDLSIFLRKRLGISDYYIPVLIKQLVDTDKIVCSSNTLKLLLLNILRFSNKIFVEIMDIVADNINKRSNELFIKYFLEIDTIGYHWESNMSELQINTLIEHCLKNNLSQQDRGRMILKLTNIGIYFSNVHNRLTDNHHCLIKHIKKLFESGAEIYIKNIASIAGESGELFIIEILKMCIQYKGDLIKYDSTLNYIENIKYINFHILEFLLSNRKNMGCTDDANSLGKAMFYIFENNIPICRATKIDVVKLFIDNGAKINPQLYYGRDKNENILHYLFEYLELNKLYDVLNDELINKLIEIVKIALDAGVSATEKNGCGKTPADVLKEIEHIGRHKKERIMDALLMPGKLERDKIEEEKKRIDEEKKRIDEEKKRIDEEKWKIDEEKWKIDGEKWKIDEEKKRINEEKKRNDEEKKRIDEENDRINKGTNNEYYQKQILEYQKNKESLDKKIKELINEKERIDEQLKLELINAKMMNELMFKGYQSMNAECVCSEEYKKMTIENVVILKCKHILCTSCFQNPLITSCPTCRMAIDRRQS